ncbi:MAG TPA: serine/threonine-protein kinase [Myxococcales bacterium]|jgi:serine/threonine-protein kinase|nr:serine/threonine-protein kinase [Myxococcales bacterium]
MRIGTVIESYEILEKLGTGEVYRARHTVTGHYTAIKRLVPAGAGDLDRFMQEAVAAARIDDAGIVRVLDRLAAPDGSTLVVMELLEGKTLAARLEQEGRVPLETAALLGRQIARAVAAAHRAGIVHGDLTPSNIFLVDDDDLQGGVRAKVLDFGLARLVKRAGPAYLAPEQWRGPRDEDKRADIYSLGCIFYEMICGRPPFLGDRDELRSKHESALVLPPGMLVTSLVPAADAVVARALAKRPGDRFTDMDEFAVALGTMVGAADLATQPERRRRSFTLTAALGALLAIIAAAICCAVVARAPAGH